jgi:hypothetical protein
MPIVWTEDRLLALAPPRLEQVRQNALAQQNQGIVEICAAIQASRSKRSASPDSPVVGFHLVYDPDYEVNELADGRFWSGVWLIDKALCDPAIKLGGYVALHLSKQRSSYRQGFLLDWRIEARIKGKKPTGITFFLEPFDGPMQWFGDAAGDRSYRRLDDEPRWAPKG